MLKRTPLKRKFGLLKRKVLVKKKPSSEKIEADKLQRNTDIEFYMKIWNTSVYKIP